MNNLLKNAGIAAMCVGLFASMSMAHYHDDCDDSIGNCGSSSAFSLSPQLYWFDTRPLDDIIKTEPTLKNRSFHFERHNPIFILGLGGYHDHGNGLRTGFSIHAGYKSYYSDTYKGAGSTALRPRDSVVQLRLIPAYGGFTFDKTVRYGDMCFSLGTMIGGGVFILNRQGYDVDVSGAFTSTTSDADTINWDNRHEHSWAFAPTFAFDAHAGVSYRLAPLLHLGLDAVALCFYSPEGYGYASGEFFSFNPGLKLRLIVGRAG